LGGNLNTIKILTWSDWQETYQAFRSRNQTTQLVNSMSSVIRFYTINLIRFLFDINFSFIFIGMMEFGKHVRFGF